MVEDIQNFLPWLMEEKQTNKKNQLAQQQTAVSQSAERFKLRLHLHPGEAHQRTGASGRQPPK